MTKEEMEKMIKEQDQRIKILEETVGAMNFLQEDFGAERIIKRKTRFLDEVYDASGAKVIN